MCKMSLNFNRCVASISVSAITVIPFSVWLVFRPNSKCSFDGSFYDGRKWKSGSGWSIIWCSTKVCRYLTLFWQSLLKLQMLLDFVVTEFCNNLVLR